MTDPTPPQGTPDRYTVVRFTYAGIGGRTHLLDSHIPEPQNGGDHSGIVCDNATWWIPNPHDSFGPDLPADLHTLGTMADDATGFGTAAARWDICHACYRRAWRELLARATSHLSAS